MNYWGQSLPADINDPEVSADQGDMAGECGRHGEWMGQGGKAKTRELAG